MKEGLNHCFQLVKMSAIIAMVVSRYVQPMRFSTENTTLSRNKYMLQLGWCLCRVLHLGCEGETLALYPV